MNVTVIVVVVLLALFDIAMLVMCSHMEDRNGYYHEKHLKEQRYDKKRPQTSDRRG